MISSLRFQTMSHKLNLPADFVHGKQARNVRESILDCGRPWASKQSMSRFAKQGDSTEYAVLGVWRAKPPR